MPSPPALASGNNSDIVQLTSGLHAARPEIPIGRDAAVLQGPDPKAAPRLYPSIEPYKRFHLPVGDGHELYVAICGPPGAQPVVVLHGGPGVGISPFMRRFFDPARYMIVLFDQRGTGRSTPAAGLEANTTWHLVADIERIRTHLGIDRWQVFGGSWGSTLALL